jgi:hypothetical protein
MATLEIEAAAVKLCDCGCGQRAAIATMTDTRRGYVKGQPTRFAHGHAHAADRRRPERQSQAREALEVAQRVRLAGVAVKRDVREGLLTVAAALDDERAGRLKIADLVMAQRGWGVEAARRLLIRLRVDELKRVEALTDRQRRVIAEACS